MPQIISWKRKVNVAAVCCILSCILSCGTAEDEGQYLTKHERKAVSQFQQRKAREARLEKEVSVHMFDDHLITLSYFR